MNSDYWNLQEYTSVSTVRSLCPRLVVCRVTSPAVGTLPKALLSPF